jgi:hypothetical protein
MNVLFDSERQTVTVKGIEISLDLLAVLGDPDRELLYTIERNGNEVRCDRFTRAELGLKDGPLKHSWEH